MIILPVVIAIVAIGVIAALFYKPPEALAISGIECHTREITTYHVHSHLNIFVDGVEQSVPANIGILSSPSCLFWLHTHAGDGVIHVEAPSKREFTLGQFMDIWEQTHSGSEAFFESISGKPITIYVNGTEFSGDLQDVKLESRSQIVLAYGNPPAEIPDYDFAGLS